MGDQIDDPARVPEIFSRAFHTAANDHPPSSRHGNP
jgi:hypothetical protein